MTKRVLLAPLDPVHDVGLKLVRSALEQAGHQTILLPPDLSPEEIVAEALQNGVEVVLLSRTLGYGVAELAARFVDLAEAAGLRQKVRLAIGGMAIRPELGTELGFDGAFGPGTTPAEAVAFVEGRPFHELKSRGHRVRPELPRGYSYAYRHAQIGHLLAEIGRQFFAWAEGKTTPGVERAAIRQEMLAAARAGRSDPGPRREYARLCGGVAAGFYATGELPDYLHTFTAEELANLAEYVRRTNGSMDPLRLRQPGQHTLVFAQYGTGCLVQDVAGIKVLEAWGADGVIHFDPSWGARTEGLLEGTYRHQGDGSLLTWENLQQIKAGLAPTTLWQVRAHRGINTAETVMLAGEAGADATKINIAYGSLGGGTDPERLAIDALAAMRYAAHYGLPYDVVTNEELAGVPAHKAFAGMLISAHLGRATGGYPLLQPLFCKGPEALVRGLMDSNHVDFHAAKVMACKQIIDAPVWPGAPVGFMTHTEDRVQSSVTTALHAALAMSLGCDAVTIASADEAYSGGPIAAASRVDTLRATAETLRFLGGAAISPTARADALATELVEQIEGVLGRVAEVGFVPALYQGLLGSREDGAYPGRAGKGTVRVAAPN